MTINLPIDVDISTDFKKLERDFKKFSQAASKNFAKYAASGLTKSYRNYTSDFKKLKAQQEKSIRDVSKYEDKLIKARAKNDQAEVKRLEQLKLKSIGKINTAQKKINQNERNINKLYKERTKHAKEYVDYMKDAETKAVRVSKVLGDSSKGIAASVGDLVGALRTGNFGDLASALSGRAGKAGARVSGASRKEGDVLARVGGSLGKMAKYLGAIAGVATAVGLIVKLLIDAEAKTKGLNKVLLEGLGTTTLMGSGFRGMTKNIGILTEEAADLFRFMEMGLNAEEFAAAAVALDQAGVSVRKLTNEFKSAEGLTEALKGAQVVATAVGISTTEAIQNIGETVENLNMGYGETVERLTMISRLAKESGFHTKRFYSTVLSATTGMTMYNVRLEEAGTRLVQLTRAVGKQQAIQMLPGMAGGFKDEGMQERVKRLMIAGGAGKRILRAESETLGARADVGLKGMGQSIASIAAMGRKEQTKFLSTLETTNLELANLVKNALVARGGAKGGLGAQALAMDQLSIGGKLAFQQAQLSKFVKGGFKNLDKAGAIQLMAAEQLTGMSMSEMKANARYFKSMEGVYNILKDSDMNDPKAQEDLAKKFGVKLDEEGKLLSKDGEYLGANISEGFDKFLMASGNQAKVDEEVMKDQRQLMEDQVAMTQTLGDKVDQGVTYFLEMIWRNTNDIIDLFPFVGSERKKESRKRETLNEQRVLLENLVEQLRAEKTGKEGDTQHIDDQIARHMKVLKSIYAGENPFGAGAYKAGVRSPSGVLKTAEDIAKRKAKIMSITGHGRHMTGPHEFDPKPSPTAEGKGPTSFFVKGSANNPAPLLAKDFVYANGRLTRIDSKDQFIGGKVGGGAISALIESQEEIGTLISNLIKAQTEADRVYRKKFDEKMKQEYPEKFAEKYIEALDMREFEEFLDLIGLAGSEKSMAIKQYERWGTLSDKAQQKRDSATKPGYVIIGVDDNGTPIYGEETNEAARKRQFGRFGMMNDYIWRSGASAPIPFSSDDTVIGMKDFSKLGGAGTTINIYGGDERKVFNVVRRAMKQMGRSA